MIRTLTNAARTVVYFASLARSKRRARPVTRISLQVFDPDGRETVQLIIGGRT